MDDTLPADARIGRVALRVADLDRLVDFYTDTVGLAVRDRSEDRAVLGTGEATLLELHAAPDAPERGDDEAGLFHLALRVPDRAALGDALARLRDDWHLTGASDHGVSEALYTRDPEGNGVEVYRDRPRPEWPTEGERVAMGTEPLDLDALASDAGGAPTVPDATDVGHVHLEPTDLDAARAFYVDALGFRVRQAWGEEALFVAAGDYHHHVGLNVWNARSAPRGDGLGLAWWELVVPDSEALAAVAERLDASVDDDVVRSADPDGIAVQVRAE